MKSLSIVVEGSSDKLFFSALTPWFNGQGFTPRFFSAKDRGRLIRDAAKHVAALSNSDLIVFALDQDDDDCPPTTANRLAHVRSQTRLISVSSRCMEAWLLADTNAIRTATGSSYNSSGFTDDILDPAARIREVFYSAFKQHFSKPELASKVAPHFSPDRARSRNRSLERFVQRLSGLA